MGRSGKVSLKHIHEARHERVSRIRKYKYFILVVCEDEKTEPAYFESFRDQFPEGTLFLKTEGTGRSSLGVVEAAIEYRKQMLSLTLKEADEVWAVFDRDDAHLSPGNTARFEQAFQTAKAHNIRIAWSNEAFELWLLLHFTDVQTETELSRQDIYAHLESCIRQFLGRDTFTYTHGSTDILHLLFAEGSEENAIQRSESLAAYHQARHHTPIAANPCTHVHELVSGLRTWISYYNYSPTG